MVFSYKKLNEEAEIEKVETEVEVAPETKQAAIDLVKELLCKLTGECEEAAKEEEKAEEPAPADEEETEEIEVDAETCRESAQILVKAMGAVMESTASVEAKLEATNILNKSLKKIMEEAGIEETDGGLPEEACESEEKEETCVVVGEKKPTDVDVAAANGECEVKESAAVALLRQMLKK